MPCLMYVKIYLHLCYPASRGSCRDSPTNIFQLRNERNVISTALSTSGSSIDYATRMAKILARKMRQPVYVGCSINCAGTTAEEEMEGFTVVVDQIMQKWNPDS